MTPRILLFTGLAAMMVATGTPASAQPGAAPERSAPAKAAPKSATKPAPKAAPGTAAPRTSPKATPKAATTNDPSFGRWDSSWGAKPPAPPKSYTNKADWHRHVRACQRSYRSYNARTDSYRNRAGNTVRCRL